MPKIHSIAIASDHAGYDLKETLCDHLKENGHQVENLEPTLQILLIIRTTLTLLAKK